MIEIAENTQEEMTDVEHAVADDSTGTQDRPYTLRKLKDSDLFPLLRLIKALGIKELSSDIKDKAYEVYKDYQDKEHGSDRALERAGLEVMLSLADDIIGKLDVAEDAIYDFWSELSGIPVDEMKDMEFGTLPLMIYDTCTNAANTSFFKVLSRFLK